MKAGCVVTVFGGSGFIGRTLIQRLAKAGYVVRIPTRDLVRAGRLRTAGAVGQIVPFLCPLRDPESITRTVRGASAVINLVGILYESRFARFSRLHGDLPGLIAKTAAAENVGNLAHISAIGADAASPSAYARSKAAGEAAVRAAFPAATILRPSIVFGPEDNFFNHFAGLARLSPILPLIGGGNTRFQPVYVGDVADAIMAAIQQPAAQGKTYELGGPEVLTFRQLMEKTMEWSGLHRHLLSVPFPLAMVKASVLELLPKPLLTTDQVKMLKHDNVVAPGALTLADLGITATGLAAVVPGYLGRFQPGGPFAKAE